jgi:hypothetical protein
LVLPVPPGMPGGGLPMLMPGSGPATTFGVGKLCDTGVWLPEVDYWLRTA